MAIPTHRHVTNLSGNKIYCLNRLGLKPGNSVFAPGIMGSQHPFIFFMKSR